MRYDAFISYRHTPLDMEMAKKVHTGLETYHVPAAVQKKTGKKKIQRVFRDQEELPIGSDLNDNISGALEQSEFLIVICSPNTPGSYWVCKEIETFIQMHGREHILAVLIEGEPDESFPSLLLSDENGNPVEPLAADVRGETAKERNTKFKTEILRLAAPVLGCSYDDLRQRHRERIIKRTIATVSSTAAVVALAGAAFGIYNAGVAKKMKALADEKAQLAEEKSELADEKTRLADEILREYKEKQVNQAKFYAEKSLSLLGEGQRADAALVAIEALPSEENDRPYVGQAEYALAQSLYAYSTGDYYSFDRVLEHDSKVKSSKINADRSVFLVLDTAMNVYARDAKTFELKVKIPAFVDENNSREEVRNYDADADGVYIVTNDALYKYGYDGSLIYKLAEGKELLGRSDLSSCSFDINNGIAALTCCKEVVYDSVEQEIFAIFDKKDYVVDIVDLKTGKVLKSIDYPKGYEPSGKNEFSKEGKTLFVENRTESGENTTATLFNIEDGSTNIVELPVSYISKIEKLESGDFCLALGADILSDENFLKVCVIDSPTGRVKWIKDVDIENTRFWVYDVNLKSHVYEVGDAKKKEIVVTHGSYAYTLDEENGEVIQSLFFSNSIASLTLYRNNGGGIAGLSDGQIVEANFNTGEFTGRSVDTGKAITDVVGFDYFITVNESLSSNIYVLTQHLAPDLETIRKSETDAYIVRATDDGKYLLLRSFDEEAYIVCGPDGNELYKITDIDTVAPKQLVTNGDKLIHISSKLLKIFDLETKEDKEIVFEDYIDYFTLSGSYITENRKYALLCGYRSVMIADLEKFEIVYSLDDSDLFDNNMILNACISEDGKSVYVSLDKSGLTKIDIESGNITKFENDDLIQSDVSRFTNSLTINKDGNMIAMGCLDGNIRVFDAATGECKDIIPLETTYNTYLNFIGDGKYLLSQNDDYSVKIRDIEKNEIVGIVSMNGQIDFISEGDGKIALSGSRKAVVMDGDSFATIAEASGDSTVVYSIANKAFYIAYTNQTDRVFYKDYKTLIKMAKNEFSDAVLTDEKKVRYNIQ